MSSLATFTRPSNSRARSPTIGPSARHGPHHSAHRSTRAAPRCDSISAEKLSSVTSSTGDSLLTSFISLPPPIHRIGISISIYITTKYLNKIPYFGATRLSSLSLSQAENRPRAEGLRRHVARLPLPPYRADPRAHAGTPAARHRENDKTRIVPLAMAR